MRDVDENGSPVPAEKPRHKPARIPRTPMPERGADGEVPTPAAPFFSLAFGPMILLIRDHIMDLSCLDENLIQRVTEACWDAIKR